MQSVQPWLNTCGLKDVPVVAIGMSTRLLQNALHDCSRFPVTQMEAGLILLGLERRWR